MEKLLQEVGLTQAEAKVYLALLEIGETTSTAIINRTHLHKGTVYEILGRLIDKSLVYYVVKQNKRHFIAASPKDLMKFVKRKEEDLQSFMPKLLALEDKRKKPNIKIGEGILTVRSEVEDIAAGNYICSAGMDGRAFEMLKQRSVYFIKKMARNPKFKGRVILKRSQKKAAWFKQIELFPKNKTEVRFVPDDYNLPLINIWGNTVSLGMGFGDKPIAVMVEDERIRKRYVDLFNLIWKHAKSE
jgi:sugar-specific transcriptional regulator TrmB